MEYFPRAEKVIFAHMARNLKIDQCLSVEKGAVVPFKAAINGTNIKIASPIINMEAFVQYLQTMHIFCLSGLSVWGLE